MSIFLQYTDQYIPHNTYNYIFKDDFLLRIFIFLCKIFAQNFIYPLILQILLPLERKMEGVKIGF